MDRDLWKIVGATLGFAALHSALASAPAKRAAARLLGKPARDAWFRPLYLAQAALSFGALVVYVRRQPERTVYEVRGPAAALMRAGQAAGLAYAAWAAHHVGIPRMLGMRGLRAWAAGEPVPPTPEAQGPVGLDDGSMKVTGPFRRHRHPLNFAPLPVTWLFPRMTSRLLAFNLAATGYLVLGSVHEEMRLREAYGDAYLAYLASGVPFYLPAASSAGTDAGSARSPESRSVG